jgi:hypothetical protein
MFLLSGTKILRGLVSALSLCVSPQLLAVWIAVPFVYYGVVLGATFWVDGFCYSGLAAAFHDPDLFREFNSGWGRISLGHLQPGVAVLCWGLDFLPANLQWPTLAVAQRSIAFAALLWTILQVSDYRPTIADAAVFSLLIWNPFYQSFHNALLTESLSSSLMLVVVGAAFAMRRRTSPGSLLVGLGAIALFCLTNIRSYLGVAALLMLCLGAIRLKSSRSWVVCSIFTACAIVAAGAYPLARVVKSGDWFLPGNDMVFLLAAGWSSQKGGTNYARALAELPAPARAVASELEQPDGSFDYADAKLLFDRLQESGKSPAEASATFRDLARALNADNALLPQIRVLKAAISCGFVVTGSTPSCGLRMDRQRNSEKFAEHQRNTYKYHSWFWGGDQFDNFFKAPQATFVATAEGQSWFRRTHEQYVKKALSRSVLDPFSIGGVPFDVWALVGVICIIALAFTGDAMRGLILGTAVSINFAVMFSVPLGNPRYGYSMLPLYLIAVVSLLHAARSRSGSGKVVGLTG